MTSRKYYNQRAGGLPRTLALAEAAKLIGNLYHALESKGWFQEAFGYTCVDDGFCPGTAGEDIAGFIYVRTYLDECLPLREKLTEADEVRLFTLVEFLYDCVSEPKRGRQHTWNNCGWHYETFDRDAGRGRWRKEVNQILEICGEGFELSLEGEIQRFAPPGLDKLSSDPIPQVEDDKHKAKLKKAIHTFRLGRSTAEERRLAVRELADLLEYFRPQIKEHMLESDESDLFNLANRFGIRHYNEAQKTDYGAEWLDWTYYMYLSTIRLVMRLIERQEMESAEPTPPENDIPF